MRIYEAGPKEPIFECPEIEFKRPGTRKDVKFWINEYGGLVYTDPSYGAITKDNAVELAKFLAEFYL